MCVFRVPPFIADWSTKSMEHACLARRNLLARYRQQITNTTQVMEINTCFGHFQYNYKIAHSNNREHLNIITNVAQVRGGNGPHMSGLAIGAALALWLRWKHQEIVLSYPQNLSRKSAGLRLNCSLASIPKHNTKHNTWPHSHACKLVFLANLIAIFK